MTAERRYRLSPLAESDLEDIWLYTFKTWSREQADSYHASPVEAFRGLADGRKVGWSVSVRDGYVRYAVGAHVLFYRQVVSAIEIIRVLHQRMDVERHPRSGFSQTFVASPGGVTSARLIFSAWFPYARGQAG